MAVTRASFAVCIIFSLAAIAAADYYTPQSPPVENPTLPPVYTPPVTKPTLPTPVYTPPVPKPTLPPPVYTPPVKKPTLPPPVYTPPVKKPTLPPPVYTHPIPKSTLPQPVYTPPVTKPTLPPPVYTPPVYTPPVTKPTLPPPVYKPKPETKAPTSYSPPTSEDSPKPYTPSPPVLPYVPQVNITIAIDGFIFCKHGYNTYPIIGARAKLVCSSAYGEDQKGLVIYSELTNERGYFYLAVTEDVTDISLCEVKLDIDFTPDATCKIPTNVNKGLTGVPLSFYHFFPDKNLDLYSVGPFFFTGSDAPHPHQPKY